MKRILNVLLFCVLATGIAMACPPQGDAKTEKAAVETKVEGTFATLNLDVKGMTCAGCENKVKAALGSIDGVVEAQKVCSQSDKASLTYDPNVVSEEQIVKTLAEKTGYSVTMIKNAGMTEAAESATNEVSSTAKKATCTKSQKAACTKGQKAACTKSQKAACSKSKAKAETLKAE